MPPLQTAALTNDLLDLFCDAIARVLRPERPVRRVFRARVHCERGDHEDALKVVDRELGGVGGAEHVRDARGVRDAAVVGAPPVRALVVASALVPSRVRASARRTELVRRVFRLKHGGGHALEVRLHVRMVFGEGR